MRRRSGRWPAASATSRIALRTSSFEASDSPPARFASWAKTPAALPRAPGSADGVARARPDQQAAVRAAQRLLGPVVTDLPLDQQMAVRAECVACRLGLAPLARG